MLFPSAGADACWTWQCPCHASILADDSVAARHGIANSGRLASRSGYIECPTRQVPHVTLPAGTRLGVYEIVSPLGSGGMGEVYRGRDSRLRRDVAIKVLPESLANDPDRLARFEREAQLLASLNHPHIAQIFGVEESGSVRALVMELVEGEDLSKRIQRGAIGIAAAVAIARQIAEALESAHRRGIVHRDLKPANIQLRPDGTVKILDFGLAKAVEAQPIGAGNR